MLHCLYCLVYEVLESYMQDIAYSYIVDVLSCVDWFGTDLDWELLEEAYFYAMHNSSFFN